LWTFPKLFNQSPAPEAFVGAVKREAGLQFSGAITPGP
jgi:hypothetical protein